VGLAVGIDVFLTWRTRNDGRNLDHPIAEPVVACGGWGSRGVPVTLKNIGGVHQRRGEPQATLGCYEQALRIFREVGDRAGEAATLYNLGRVHQGRGDWQAALGCYEQALRILREVGDLAGVAATLNDLGGPTTAAGTGRLHSTATRRRCVSSGRSGTEPVWRPR
jgi:tetratricopeptide (TPR) repeat protein